MSQPDHCVMQGLQVRLAGRHSRHRRRTMSVFHDEVEIEDFEYDPETETYYYPCPCGDQFEISKVGY